MTAAWTANERRSRYSAGIETDGFFWLALAVAALRRSPRADKPYREIPFAAAVRPRRARLSSSIVKFSCSIAVLRSTIVRSKLRTDAVERSVSAMTVSVMTVVPVDADR
jgi:hypothetical protein